MIDEACDQMINSSAALSEALGNLAENADTFADALKTMGASKRLQEAVRRTREIYTDMIVEFTKLEELWKAIKEE